MGTSQKSIIQVYNDKKLEDIYNELLEQSLNEGYQDANEVKNNLIINLDWRWF